MRNSLESSRQRMRAQKSVEGLDAEFGGLKGSAVRRGLCLRFIALLLTHKHVPCVIFNLLMFAM